MSQNIIPKDCTYGCNTRIYWNTVVNEYWEVLAQKKHVCPNRSSNNAKPQTTNTATATKPNYYNKFAKQQFTKPKMSNSFEYLQGSITEIQKKYEALSDIVTEYNGKVPRVTTWTGPRTGQLIDLLVYYEVPIGQRDEVKRKFNDFVLSIIPRTN